MPFTIDPGFVPYVPNNTPAGLPAPSTPATDWGATFGKILTTAVDTGAALTLANANQNQQRALAAQQTQQVQTAAAAQVQTASTAAATSAGWQKMLLYGGAGLAAVAVLVMILRRPSS